MTLLEAAERLKSAGVDAYLHDAREIFLHVLGLNRYLPIDKNQNFESEKLEELVARRAMREPLAYVLGECIFYNEEYEITPDVLVPRPDTEILVDYAVKNIPAGASFLDLCTGSGCVAISTLRNTDSTVAAAFDISDGALAVARRNANKNGVSDRLTLLKSDLLSDPLPEMRVYAVLSNPPYIPSEVCDTLSPEVMREPRIALEGGEDGLVFYKRIIPMAKEVISDGGFIAFEIGYDEGDALRELAGIFDMSVEIIKDYSSLDRVAVLRKK